MSERLTQEDLSALMEDGHVLPGTSAGKRKVSAAFTLTPPSSGGSSAAATISSVSSTASVQYYYSAPHNHISDFPDEQESVAALEYIGLEPTTAQEIFERWQTRPDPEQCPDELLDYVYGNISQLRSESWDNISDAEALSRLGVAPWLRNVLLDPSFKDIYESESLEFWLQETFRGNYRSIETTQNQLKAYVKDRKNNRKKQKRGSVTDAFPSQQDQDSSSSDPTALSQHVATMSLASGSRHLPQTKVSIRAAEPRLPDHRIFYKAKAINEMNQTHMFIGEDGSIDMRAIASGRGGDFNPLQDALYWTLEYETACKYRDWAARRARSGEIAIIQIQVSGSFLQTLHQEDLWFSPNWKEYVWWCKREPDPEDIPEKFTKYWKPGPDQTDIMFGHICTGLAPNIRAIKPHEVQTKMSEDKLVKNGNIKATQWVVMHRDVAKRLAVEVVGKMHIEIFSATEPKVP